ncbi:phosphatase PAP2 family protein [Microbacterium sp. BWR-S6Y]|uniref:phosphatase PAP2 family protein n=1 Tax=Microbacterium sp. BWR-S6Y TaxID=3232073 RepID=UPI0035293A1F
MTPPPAWSGSPLTTPPARLRRAALIAVATVFGLVLVGFVLRFTNLDAAASTAIHHLRHGVLAPLAEALYLALKPVPAALLMLVSTGVVAGLTRSWRQALVFLGTIALTWGSAEAIKLVVDRPRPGLSEAAMATVGKAVDASFPSGHVAFTAAFVVTCAYLAWGTRWRAFVIAPGALLVACMIAAVVVEGVHYLGDALASLVWVAGIFPVARGLCAVAVARADAEVRRRRSRQVV